VCFDEWARERLNQQDRANGILVDTNLLLLYIVGSIDIERIRSFKRTSIDDTDDFDIVLTLINLFDNKIVSTPHILSQVSDLVGKNDTFRSGLKQLISGFVSQEIFVKGSILVQSSGFASFGIADTAIIEMAKQSYLVFTDDNSLYGFLKNTNSDALSLNQFRQK
jgi:hypothetical protein